MGTTVNWPSSDKLFLKRMTGWRQPISRRQGRLAIEYGFAILGKLNMASPQ